MAHCYALFVWRDKLGRRLQGQVLTTLVDRGVYADPAYGLNNLTIPEKLSKQDYWYRVEFRSPKAARDHRLTLMFEGINYAAAVWLNGARIS